MYSHKDIINFCMPPINDQKWTQLQQILDSDNTQIKYRILISATFEAYHENALARRRNGLNSRWGKNNLSTGKQRLFSSFFGNAADLTDFYYAYIIAKNELCDPNQIVASRIKHFIQANQNILGKLLDSYNLPEYLKTEFCIELGLRGQQDNMLLAPPNSPNAHDATSDTSPSDEEETPRYYLRSRQ